LNDFQENAVSALLTLRKDREFADVTLACEDGQQMEAHRVILASSSPFFMNLLKRNKHPHPLIYMRGLKSNDLVTMIDFLYYSEVNIYQENLDSFLALAEELQLKGFMDSGSVKTSEYHTKHPITKNIIPTQMHQEHEVNTRDTFNFEQKVKSEPFFEGADVTVASNSQDLDDKIKSMMKIRENSSGDKFKGNRSRTCKVCGKEGKLSRIRDHIEANHITGISHTCNICGKSSSTRDALRRHKYNRCI